MRDACGVCSPVSVGRTPIVSRMRVVHVIDRDASPGHLVVATADGLEQFELEVDQALRAAVGGPAAHAPAPAKPSAARSIGTEPKISPREIQVRVRAGETPQEISEANGADLEWVQRFAQPVLAERARIAHEARRSKARRSTTEGQTVIFGEAVDARFAAHGIDPAAVSWDAYRREDAQWIITARWIGGQSEHEADWVCHLSARTVTPLDDTAADLLSDRPIRPIEPAPEPAPATPSLTLAPPLAPGLVAFPAMPDAHTGPLPRAEEVFDQSRFDEPPLPLHVPGHPSAQPGRRNLGVANKPAESEDEKAARASIPSWDDILLGVRRKND